MIGGLLGHVGCDCSACEEAAARRHDDARAAADARAAERKNEGPTRAPITSACAMDAVIVWLREGAVGRGVALAEATLTPEQAEEAARDLRNAAERARAWRDAAGRNADVRRG